MSVHGHMLDKFAKETSKHIEASGYIFLHVAYIYIIFIVTREKERKKERTGNEMCFVSLSLSLSLTLSRSLSLVQREINKIVHIYVYINSMYTSLSMFSENSACT